MALSLKAVKQQLPVFDTESVRRTTHNLVVPRGMLVLAAVLRVPEPGADDVVTSGTGGQGPDFFKPAIGSIDR